MEIRGEAEGEVREESSGSSRVDVFTESTRDESPREGDWDRCDEAEEETENGDGDADGGSHGTHVERFHGCLLLSTDGVAGSVSEF